MKLFDLFRPNAGKPLTRLAPVTRVVSDPGKTEIVQELFKIPHAERDDEWRSLFYRSVRLAGFASTGEVFKGPDGFSYFLLRTPDDYNAEELTCIERLKDELLDKGLGVVINPDKKSAEWVFTHGDIVNLHLNDAFETTGTADPQHIDMTKKLEVIKKGEQVMVAQPSAKYLPYPTRHALRKFMQENNISRPSIMLMCQRQQGLMVQKLVFNIHAEDFESPEACDYRMQQLSWFLPSHYILVSLPKSSALTRDFDDL